MSETKWEIRENAIGSYEVVSVFVSGEYVVAKDMPIEDARMTAASPDLYAALEKLLAKVECGTAINCAVCDAARAALSSARGETT